MPELHPVAPEDAAIRQKIRALYEEAFPKRERVPFGALTNPGRYELLEITEEGTFCGFSACRRRPGLSSLVYFAIDPALRSRGIGGAALDLILEHLAGAPVFIDIEDPEEPCEDQPLRQRRCRFYLRHGFESTEIVEAWQGVRYRILTRDGHSSRAEIERFWASE